MTDVDGANRIASALVGLELVQFRMGYGLHLELGGDFEVTIETPLSVIGSTTWNGEPLSAQSAGAVLPLLHLTLRESRVTKDGMLSLDFGRTVLSVRPHPDFEAWQIQGPDGVLVVCVPGGGVIVWRAQS